MQIGLQSEASLGFLIEADTCSYLILIHFGMGYKLNRSLILLYIYIYIYICGSSVAGCTCEGASVSTYVCMHIGITYMFGYTCGDEHICLGVCVCGYSYHYCSMKRIGGRQILKYDKIERGGFLDMDEKVIFFLNVYNKQKSSTLVHQVSSQGYKFSKIF